MGIKATGLEIYLDNLVEHFDRIVLHPEGNGFIFYLSDGRDNSLKGILNEIKCWRKSQGLPLFKDSE
ncbi:bacteriocin immunity protein [Pectobacterium actinidiae]|uniref:bacteriocin immunity protein n=1 Tax=Pectobacterium actinidiae TaxID=1507808 RepID=UPI002A7F5379|nr:bacteriocin immunity protein [Pectobacterium actinidiae]MDY4314478.1 bacteriocin immunity protein [Pectobacterium actinidiae]